MKRETPPSDDPKQRSSTKLQQPKGLRFITNHGAPPPKRRRISAACLTCRKRKTACSGERPICETCQQHNLDCAGYSCEVTAASHKPTVIEESPTTNCDITSAQPNGSAIRAEQERLTELPDVDRRASSGPSASAATGDSTENADIEPHDGEVEGEKTLRESLFPGPRNRMPYFRWLGPTAIMPGFKQMVVKVNRSDSERGRTSTDGAGAFSPLLQGPAVDGQRVPSTKFAAVEADARTPPDLPFYDTSPVPPSELITHLANTFFTHLGCNYPFLQRDRFMHDLEEKQVHALLVDAVCALAARFSTHPLLTQQDSADRHNKMSPAEYGHVFAQRAKTALLESFTCPSIAAVQAALLLAYNEFGEQRDSGLWMYLGIAIRMAQDLGIQKREGLRFVGKTGPTPKMVKKDVWNADVSAETSVSEVESHDDNYVQHQDAATVEEQKHAEKERCDTFWAVFFLDRVVSSGTGRRSTIRDKDIEISFPPLDEVHAKSGWPAPFPALIRIIHLYGRVADLLNSIKEPSDMTFETPKRLAGMEKQVTGFYQGLSSRLHFDAVNFQHYVKHGEGTNFVLLHFWFHTLIVLLHRPTLLKTFEGRMLQLFPNSQQLSMSSAKTIADILSYSQLMDAKASLGNPFTTQPIYIAACAFLKETVEQTASSNTQSRASSPQRAVRETADSHSTSATTTYESWESAPPKRIVDLYLHAKEQRTRSKHTLLATAANQHYRLCYKALQSLETYWAGTKYILTVLDQKFEGVGDPVLYTAEERECSLEKPKPEPAFTSPGWRRKLSSDQHNISQGTQLQHPLLNTKGLAQIPGSPAGDPFKAIGWTLTGSMNSSNTNLAWHYPAGNAGTTQNPRSQLDALTFSPPDHSSPAVHVPDPSGSLSALKPPPSQYESVQHAQHTQPQLPSQTSFPASTDASSNPDTNLSAGLMSQVWNSALQYGTGQSTIYPTDQALSMDINGYGGAQPFGDLTIESQDIDMSLLGLDTMPWFDTTGFLTHDLMGVYDSTHINGHDADIATSAQLPGGGVS